MLNVATDAHNLAGWKSQNTWHLYVYTNATGSKRDSRQTKNLNLAVWLAFTYKYSICVVKSEGEKMRPTVVHHPQGVFDFVTVWVCGLLGMFVSLSKLTLSFQPQVIPLIVTLTALISVFFSPSTSWCQTLQQKTCYSEISFTSPCLWLERFLTCRKVTSSVFHRGIT